MSDEKHNKEMSKLLVGKTIQSVSYLDKKTADKWGWYSRPLTIIFTDGSMLMPQRDDEGNDGGAMYFQDKEENDYENHIVYVLN
jgi:hypothetical protein